jgi:hypothetical protein
MTAQVVITISHTQKIILKLHFNICACHTLVVTQLGHGTTWDKVSLLTLTSPTEHRQNTGYIFLGKMYE